MTENTQIQEITLEEITEKLSSFDVTFESVNEDTTRVIVDSCKEDIVELVKVVYELESKGAKLLLDIKKLSEKEIEKAIRFSLSYEGLKDPLMILNILNLIKVYNTLNSSFFESKDIYFKSTLDFLNIKLTLKDELKAFKKQLSIYFLSLFKSYNKISFTPSDNVIDLPEIYQNLLLTTDILTLSGIFATSDTFSTDECVFIKESFKYISNLLIKNSISLSLMNSFLEDFNKKNPEELNNGNSI